MPGPPPSSIPARPLLGFLFPRPPLDVAEKAWVERHLLALVERLGADRLGFGGGPMPETLAPSAVPEAGRTDDDSVLALAARFAAHVGVNADGLRAEWFEDRPADLVERSRSVLGALRRGEAGPVLELSAELRPRPEALAATVAHELCREALLNGSEGRGDGDGEPHADLAAAALGLGAFAANGGIRGDTAPGGAGSPDGPRGPLTSREIGYALACLLYARGVEGTPPWVGELRPDAAEAVTGGLRYLRRTGDTRFTGEAARRGPRAPAEADVLAGLHHRRPSERLAAAWDAAELGSAGADALGAFCEATRDREPAVRAAACAAVGVHVPAPADRADDWERGLLALVAAAADPAAAVRAAALRGLAALPELPADGPGREELDRVIEDGLTARTPAIRAAAAAVLPRLPESGARDAATPSPFAPAVLKALTGALVRCDDAEAAEHAAVLRELHPAPATLVAERVPDEELRARVSDALGVRVDSSPDPDPAASGAGSDG